MISMVVWRARDYREEVRERALPARRRHRDPLREAVLRGKLTPLRTFEESCRHPHSPEPRFGRRMGSSS